MNELLKINYEAEQPTVSARDLHEALGVASRFSRWFDSNKELFVELILITVLGACVINFYAIR